MSEWFKDWFNSDFYLDVYAHRNDEDAKKIVELILSLIKLQTASKILDSSCGNGRHAVNFAQKGFKVTGFDLSPQLLKFAKAEAIKNNLNIKLINADIRNFFIKEKFDLIVNLFTSFGYFESDSENFLFFKNALNMMKEKSFLVFDYFNYDFIIRNLVEQDTKKINGITIKQNRTIQKGRIIKEIHIKKEQKEFTFIESVKLYEKDNLIGIFRSLGFKIIKLLGDYSGNDFDQFNSPRLIIFMQK